MSRKLHYFTSLLIVSVMLLSLLAACGGEEAESTEPPAPTEAAAEEEMEQEEEPAEEAMDTSNVCEGLNITVSSISETYGGIFLRWEEDMKDELGNFTMEFVQVPVEETYQKDMLEFAGGATENDIVFFQPAWIADYAPHLANLGDLADQYNLEFHLDDALPIFTESYMYWEGDFLAIPVDADEHNFYINRAAFEDEENKAAFEEEVGRELAVPETWDEYVEVANFFAGRDWDHDGEAEFGVSEAWLRGGYAYWWWLSKFFGYGGVYFDEEMNPLINSPAGIKALEIQLAIADAVPPGAANFGSGEARNAWLVGDVPMVVHWTSSAKLAKDPEASQIVDEAWVELVPGVRLEDGTIHRRAALPTGWSMGVVKYASEQDQACAAHMLEYLSQPEISKEIALDAAFWAEPWRTSTFEPEVWNNKWPNDVEYGQNLARVMEGTLEIGVPDLQIPGQDEYVKAADAEISAVLAGEKDPEQALNDAAAEWDAITDRLGREEQKRYWNIQYDALKARGIEYRPEIAE